MIVTKTLICFMSLIVSAASAEHQFKFTVASNTAEIQRDLKRVLEPKKGKVCKIKEGKTNIKGGKANNARKCADQCLDNMKCKGIQYNSKNQRCVFILDEMKYAFPDAPPKQAETMFCGKVYKVDGNVADPSSKLDWYDCRSGTVCKNIISSKAVKVAQATFPAACAKACSKITNCRSFQFHEGQCTALQYRTRSVSVVPTLSSQCCKAPK